jgi:hypothetical protein
VPTHFLSTAGMFLLAMAAPLAPSHSQARAGPTLAAGLAWGHQPEDAYSTTSWSGFQTSLTLPLRQATAFGAVVLHVSRDVFWTGSGDDCVIRPPDTECVPAPPSVTALTVGWRHALGQSQPVLYVGAGRMSGRRDISAGGLVRLTVGIGGRAGLQLYGQYMLVPSFEDRTLQTFRTGVNLYLR